MENKLEAADDYEDVWELADFCMREAFALRSLLEYLRLSNDTVENKISAVENWKQAVGLHLGNPAVAEGTSILQRFRDANPKIRKEAIRQALAQAQSVYFGDLD